MSGIKMHDMRCDSCIHWELFCKSDLGEGAASSNYCARTSRGFVLKTLSIPSVLEQNKITADMNRKIKEKKNESWPSQSGKPETLMARSDPRFTELSRLAGSGIVCQSDQAPKTKARQGAG